MIEVKNLTKEFKKPVRKQGVWGMLTSLFSKEYETKIAVNDVSFTIQDGEIVGYIGSNGAGKSTTIKMMCGILNPTSGEVRINGEMPYKKRMEFLCETLDLKEFLSQPVRTLSLGQRMRADLAASWLHNPSIFIYANRFGMEDLRCSEQSK